jgi:pimeloyl-ACP methyl ester carboxylesterase
LLAVDRPGYGGSGLGIPMISVKEQASNVAAIIRERRANVNQPIILHGSSYGGTVSARIAMDFPDLIKGLLLQSASTAPREEYTYWATHPTSHWSLNWLLPSSLQTANSEKLSHQQQLEEMVDNWTNIKANTVILHGTDDWLIYPPNAYYSCDQLVNAIEVIHHMVPGKKHDLIWSAPKLLREYLLKLIKRETALTDSLASPPLPQG